MATPIPDAIRQASFVDTTAHYLEYYSGTTEHTTRAKKLDLNHFTSFLTRYYGYAQPKKLLLSDWSTEATQAFLTERLDRGETSATVARRFATLKHMGRIVAEIRKGFIDPTQALKLQRSVATRPPVLSKTDIDSALLKARERLKEKNTFNRQRNEALFILLLNTGLRVEEVRTLLLGQVDATCEWICNVKTKGKRYRNIHIPDSARPFLCDYLKARSKKLQDYFQRLPPAEDQKLPLFISSYNANVHDPNTFLMGAKSIWRAINEFTTGTSLHPHLLRHSYAVELIDSSKNLATVSQVLGHTDIRITKRYEKS